MTYQNNFNFPGQYYDAETGLHYNWQRYYDPETGRYLTPDPIGLEGGINPFVYTENNPINYIDPFGLQGFAIDAGGGYGSGGGGKYSSGKDYATGFFIGVKPDSMGHAQLGAFTYETNAEKVPGHRFGAGYTFTRYYGDAKEFFSGTLNYTSRNFFGFSKTTYTDPCTGEKKGWSISLWGDGFGLTGKETGITTTTSSYFLQE